jgi:hypothetical protein
MADGVVALRPWREAGAPAIVSAHWNPRLGRRQDWAMYSLLPHEPP